MYLVAKEWASPLFRLYERQAVLTRRHNKGGMASVSYTHLIRGGQTGEEMTVFRHGGHHAAKGAVHMQPKAILFFQRRDSVQVVQIAAGGGAHIRDIDQGQTLVAAGKERLHRPDIYGLSLIHI